MLAICVFSPFISLFQIQSLEEHFNGDNFFLYFILFLLGSIRGSGGTRSKDMNVFMTLKHVAKLHSRKDVCLDNATLTGGGY